MTMRKAIDFLRRCFDWEYGASSGLLARWIFLRALALIYFSAFYSLLFQIKGLIGPLGILPAEGYLRAIARYYGTDGHRGSSYWHALSLFWISSSAHMMMVVTRCGIAAALL